MNIDKKMNGVRIGPLMLNQGPNAGNRKNFNKFNCKKDLLRCTLIPHLLQQKTK